MSRTLAIFAAVAVVAILVFVGLGRTGAIDMKKPVTAIPAGAIPHGGAEKPVAETTGIAR
jgi:hypothetical protein